MKSACARRPTFAAYLDAEVERVRLERRLGVLLTTDLCSSCDRFHVTLRYRLKQRDFVALGGLARGQSITAMAPQFNLTRQGLQKALIYIIEAVQAKHRTHLVASAIRLGLLESEE